LAGSVPTDVILFNIDSRNSTSSNRNKDSILNVFLSVFNKHQGLYDKSPYIADLERKLIADGKYEEFQRVFKDISGKEWKKSRAEIAFMEKPFTNALVQVADMSESTSKEFYKLIIKKDAYELSINDFAEKVNDYCKSKGDNHHVVFLVDEVGQYIGDDSRLMLNLQTLVEDLSTKCKGKAWVIVTSQQAIDEITKVKGDDFSKIQARFKTQLSLSSSDVGEVIRIRILSKKEDAKQVLRSQYQEIEPVLKNLLVFSDDTAEMKLYKNAEDFAAVYPFVPYQLNLLGLVLTSIRIHSSGSQHMSDRERSMLQLFRDVAVSVKDEETGVLVSFDKFYQALGSYLDDSPTQIVNNAAKNEKLKPFDIKVLKTLFMIKYIKEIPATIENLTTLLIDNVNADRISLQQMISASLQRLMRETLVQKNGSVYIFLTDDEQTVNKAINKETVEGAEISLKISDIVFEDILPSLKVATDDRGLNTFPFKKSVDGHDRKSGPSNLTLSLITANNPDDWNEAKLRAATASQSQSEGRMIVALKGDGAYLSEIRNILQIHKYVTRMGTSQHAHSAILEAKNREVKEAEERIRASLEEALRDADIYVAGNLLTDISQESPVKRLQKALTRLVSNTYYKFGLLEEVGDKNFKKLLDSSKQVTLDSDTRPNQSALTEVLNYIRDVTRRGGEYISLSRLVSKFKDIPYGFNKIDISWLVAALFADNEITLKMHGDILSLASTPSSEIELYLTKTEYEDQLLIGLYQKVSPEYVKGVKTLLKSVFEVPVVPTREEELFKSLMDKVESLSSEKKLYYSYYDTESRYPGKRVVEKFFSYLDDIRLAGNIWSVFKLANEIKDDLIDSYEDMSYIKGFFGSDQRVIFDSALKALDKYDNTGALYSFDSAAKEAISQIRNITEMPHPYSSINSLPDHVAVFNRNYNEGLDNMKSTIREGVKESARHINQYITERGMPESAFSKSPSLEFQNLCHKLDNAATFMAINSIPIEKENITQRLFNIVDEWVQKKESESAPADAGTSNSWGGVSEKKTVFVSFSSLKNGEKMLLESEEDIDDFISSIRYKLQKELEKGDIIQLR
ncbi:BREX system P-loop protein BrxC, partial [Methanocorpusculum sp.]|nr:BREX system P-loop protein BrxC [Methanocorpusculum sp.]